MYLFCEISHRLNCLSRVYGLAFLYDVIVYPYNDDRRWGVADVIDVRIGKRLKQRREELGLTQDKLAERTGFTTNYISTLERGQSFPRCEKLITLLNALETSPEIIFCDVVTFANTAKTSQLSEELASLPPDAQKRILRVVELMIQAESELVSLENT